MKVTTTVRKLLKLQKRKRVIQGGTFAGKTYGILCVLIDYATKNPKEKITVVAETIPALKDGAISQFIEIMESTGRFNHISYNRNDREYRFVNGSSIQFKSFDNVSKAKAAGKREVLFINEANHIKYTIADALMVRTTKAIWVDFNPDNEFWAHTEILPNEDSEFLLLKYTDNEGCPATIVKELEQRKKWSKKDAYWKNWCQVYIDGEIGKLQGVVFNNWKQIEIIPEEAKYVGTGCDFGYTNDPSTLIDVYKLDNTYIFNEKTYQTGLTNNEIAVIAKEDFKRYIIADSAEPKSIEEIRRHGIEIRGATKGKDSILHGIDLLQRSEFLVTSHSLNLINELRKYRWQEDRDGNATNKPIDYFNHGIDAMRYWASNHLNNPNKGRYIIS